SSDLERRPGPKAPRKLRPPSRIRRRPRRIIPVSRCRTTRPTLQSSLLAASPDPPSAAPDYAPFGQLARMLVPSAGSFAIYDAAGELAWCSDGFERPDLRALVDARAGEATRQPPTIEPTAAGVPAFVAPLDAPSGERLGCVVLELGSGHGPRQTSSMVASLLRPVLDCLVDRLSLERAVAAGGAPRESVLAV